MEMILHMHTTHHWKPNVSTISAVTDHMLNKLYV